MADTSEPAPKRRRIDATSVAHPYVTLAKVRAQVVAEWLPLSDQSLEHQSIVIKKVTMETQEFTASFPGRNANARFTLTSQALADQPFMQMLEDCARIGSVSAHDASRHAPPLTCSRAQIIQSDGQRCVVELAILWQDSIHPAEVLSPSSLQIFDRYWPSGGLRASANAEAWDPQQFYQSVHVPDRSGSDDLKVDLLHSQLFPFQRRAVRWLLEREGVSLGKNGQVLPRHCNDPAGTPSLPFNRLIDHASDKSGAGQLYDTRGLPQGFLAFEDADGRPCVMHSGLGMISSDVHGVCCLYAPVQGGILAEEMGLGKTVELLSLICLHPLEPRRSITESLVASDTSNDAIEAGPQPPMSDMVTSNRENRTTLRKSGATLIITPPTILEQWKQEIREHTPSLNLYHYEGIKAADKHDTGLVVKLSDYDIVLTTYNVIAKEVHYVTDRPDRNMRRKPRYAPPKSPLTQIHWWRVCLDEAQMVESGVSAAATVARLIPRTNAWAVTGTPLRKDHRDLFGLLLFLRQAPWCISLRIWNRLLDFYRPLFRSLMSDIAIRHSKDYVREDLRLPSQSRQTITVPFTAIEEQHYGQLFHEMCEECGLDRNGAPVNGEWDPDSPSVVEKMRTWLTRLRQTCLHPEIGGRNRRALGRSGGPLRSVLQVLDVMVDQNDSSLRQEQRNYLMSQIRRGQILENAKKTRQAMDIWRTVHMASATIVEECRTQLQVEIEARDIAMHGARSTEEQNQRSTDNEEEADADIQLTTFRQRLRVALEVKHVSAFFIANAYFQLKSDENNVKPESDEFSAFQSLEEAGYEEAKTIRTELLSEVLKKANHSIAKIRTKADTNDIVGLPRMDLPLEYTGIESRKVFEKLEDYCEAMNKQADHFDQLRQKMVDYLKQSLIDEEEGAELKGDEYESSTKVQDEMYAYMEALRALFADRGDALSGQENMLIRHEMKMALRAAKEGEGPAPEVLLKLLAERERMRIPPELGSLRGIVTEIRHLITALQWQDNSSRARAELAIASEILQHAQKLVHAQSKSIVALEQEVNQFRETMNSRLDYYRALQKISDTVAPFEEDKVGDPVDEQRYASMLLDEERKCNKISTLLSKRRYLQHLKTESSSTSTPRICTICQCDFEIGTLTVCGHQFCKECIHLWYVQHRNCPVCKKQLKANDFWDITYKPAELAIQEETTTILPDSPSGSERSLTKSIYSDISTATLKEIKDIDLNGSSFGSKVDTICRHLFWLRAHDPGSKAIIFSQYREFLDVLGRALRQYKIAYSRFDDKNGIEKFKTDPAIECFLLHAKGQSSGLNLVVANHVFLCEPLINTAIELQAIARVHRIGQQRATTVWMYLIADSVEESIYEISVARRLAHMKGKAKASSSRSGTATPNGFLEKDIDAANSLELQAADLSKLLTSGRSGGEIVDKADLWQCLFGRVKKDIGTAVMYDAVKAAGEVGMFIRAEAAEGRRTLVTR